MASYLDKDGLSGFWKEIIKPWLNKFVEKIEGKSLSTNDFTDEYVDDIDTLKSNVSALQTTKVDKISGKGLSTNDFTTAYKDQVDANKAAITGLTDSKVDKVTGKGLSTNDFTTAYKDQVDSNKSAITGLTEDKVDKVEGKGLSSNDFTTEYKNQVDTNKSNISTLQSGKVDKENGKGLSTNDFTDEHVSRLEALENVEGPSVHAHRTTFRGKYLGTSLTDAQKTAIQNGTFDDIFLGDYWTIDGVNYRVADFDYFYRCGDEDFTSHHLVVVPDKCLYTAQMNSSNVTTGGYIGSAMYTSNLATAKSKITAAFGSAVLTHKDYLTNAVSNGYPSAGAWVASTVELMNEVMVYGSAFFTPRGNGSTIPNLYTTGKMQFALFQAVPNFINIRETYWLRDVVSSAFFARCAYDGLANYYGASNSCGVRPYFCIG